jgi:hypothetical protein
MNFKLNKTAATLMVALLGSSFAAAWLVRQDGTGNVQAIEIKTATGLKNADFQALATSGGFSFMLDRSVDYTVPCVKNGTGTKSYPLFHVTETNVPMTGTPKFNSAGAVRAFDLNRASGGTIVIRNASNQVVSNAKCPPSTKHSQTEKTLITPVSGVGLTVSYMDGNGNTQTVPITPTP